MGRETVRLPADDVRAGRLPPVCVLTGEPADGLVAVRLPATPSWTWVLLLFGFVPFLLASGFATRYVEGELPVTQAAHARSRRRRRTAWWAIGGGVAVILVGIGIQLEELAFAGLAVLAGGVLLFAVVEWRFVGAAYVDDPTVVELRRVHARFVTALEGWYATSR